MSAETDISRLEKRLDAHGKRLEDLEHRLAEKDTQYAAGTPVILPYPLATETTEQTTPHSLHSYNGTTIVTADTNVDPVELSAEYMASNAPLLGSQEGGGDGE